MPVEVASLVVPRSGVGQDVVRVERFGPNSALVMLADGAGGTGGGRETAEFVLEQLSQRHEWNRTTLRQAVLEVAIEAQARDSGQTTLVIVHATDRRILGASIGDSKARFFVAGTEHVVTEGQRAKPLIGAGLAEVHLFEFAFDRGATLMICSDGVWKYATKPFVPPPLDASLDDAAKSAIDAARLPNGGLQDDSSIILVRNNHRLSPELERELRRRWEDESERNADASLALHDWVTTFSDISDGLAFTRFERVDDTLVIEGWDQHVDTQRWHPMLLHWSPRGWSFFSALAGFEGVHWAANKRVFDFDAQSDWRRCVNWP